MTKDLDPPRLRDSLDTEPELRNALQQIGLDTPDPLALSVLADGVERAAREAGASAASGTQAAASAGGQGLAAKLLLATLLGGAALFALSERAPGPPPPAAAAPPAPTITAPTPGAIGAASDRAPAGAAAAARTTRPPPISTEAGPTPTPTHEPEPTGSSGPAPSPNAASRARPREPRAAAPKDWSGSLPTTRGTGVPRITHTEPAKQNNDKRGPGFGPAAAAHAPTMSEVDLLEAAQTALVKTPAQALRLLQQHRRDFPRGQFAQERDALELEALHRDGQHARLLLGIDAFLSRYPRSPHRARIEQLAEDMR